jgi:hypothetical protein
VTSSWSLFIQVQLRVSALDNGHFQVVHEVLSKQLYETYMGCIQWRCRSRGAHEILYVSQRLGGVGICQDSAIIYYV